MADQTLNDFFAGQRLTQVAQSAAIKRGVPRDLPATLFTPSLTKPSTDQVEYIQYSGLREGARMVNRLAPAKARNLPGSTRKFATAVTTKELWAIDPTLLDALKNSYEPVRMNAQQEVIKRMADFRSMFETSRTNAVASAFSKGGVWANSDGVVLASSSGSQVAVDYGIPTGNTLTTDGAGSTYNIGDWSSASTAIQTKLVGLRTYNRKQNNYVLDTIMYGTSVPEYLQKNTTLKEYFSRNSMFRDSIVQNNVIPNGTLGFNWVPVQDHYYIDANSAVQSWFGDSFLCVIPAVEDSWYEFVEGGSQVPLGVASPSSSLETAMQNIMIANGLYSYVEQTINPMSTNLIMGDSFLPLIKVPGTVYRGVCA